MQFPESEHERSDRQCGPPAWMEFQKVCVEIQTLEEILDNPVGTSESEREIQRTNIERKAEKVELTTVRMVGLQPTMKGRPRNPATR